jgi:hypothetical protein
MSRRLRLPHSLLVLFLLLPALFTTPASAQSIDDPYEGAVELPPEGTAYPEKGAPPANPRATGRKAAEKYMAPRGGRTGAKPSSGYVASGNGADSHYLAVHLGLMMSDNAYKWGTYDSAPNIGKWNFGVTYRVGEWVNSMDLNARIDVQRYQLPDGQATKLSFLPLITFPDATSKFPLYFGVGVGLGIFAAQIANESALSLDYQIIAGARFFDIWNNTGLFVEAGMKNSAFILSDGQFNGLFTSAGAVFTF